MNKYVIFLEINENIFLCYSALGRTKQPIAVNVCKNEVRGRV